MKRAAAIFAAFFLMFLVQAVETSLSLTTDLAYFFKSDFVSGGTHFAPVTAPYERLGGRADFAAEFKFSKPLGKAALLKDGSISIFANLMASPVFLMPHFSAKWRPVPFFELEAGGLCGFGWNWVFEGLLVADENGNYKWENGFSHPYLCAFAAATLQFDTGAVFEGDWTHVVFQCIGKAYYEAVAEIEKRAAWAWMNDWNYANGWGGEIRVIAAYQMPLPLFRAGFFFDAWGHFDPHDYGKIARSFDGGFVNICLGPLFQFKFGKEDELLVLPEFMGRRSFAEAHDAEDKELFLTKSGREWIFRRVTLSWTHKFM